SLQPRSGTAPDAGSSSSIVIKALNSKGASSTISFVVTGTEAAPTITNNGNVTGTEFATVSNTGSFADVDDPVTISVLSGGGSVTQSGSTTGTWSWSGTAPDDGNPVTVVLQALNAAGAASTTSFTVSGVEAAPSISNNGNVSGAEFSTVSNSGTFA